MTAGGAWRGGQGSPAFTVGAGDRARDADLEADTCLLSEISPSLLRSLLHLSRDRDLARARLGFAHRPSRGHSGPSAQPAVALRRVVLVRIGIDVLRRW